VRLFLDTSVLLAAAGSARGASRFLIREAAAHEWELVSSDYCAEEMRCNFPKVGRGAAGAWRREITPAPAAGPGQPVARKPLICPKAKDRPVVITALATRSDWLLTLDAGGLSPETR